VKPNHPFECIFKQKSILTNQKLGEDLTHDFEHYIMYWGIMLGSSVSTVSEYRLDDWGSIPSRGKAFFF
jgi:hypothetical protein